MYAVKEICCGMANPGQKEWQQLKRLARYLSGSGRLVTKYEWQGAEDQVMAYSDSDWAGCRQTGKSTSGGVIMIGDHFIKGWSRTQNHVTTSSAEAELYAMVKCTAELMGIKSMMADWGETTHVCCTLAPLRRWPSPSAKEQAR